MTLYEKSVLTADARRTIIINYSPRWIELGKKKYEFNFLKINSLNYIDNFKKIN